MILELQKIAGGKFELRNIDKLYLLIADSYHQPEDSRFIPYYRILELLSQKQKVKKGESKVSTYLRNISLDIKEKILGNSVNAADEFDSKVEYMRHLRNMIVHPTIKVKNGSTFYTMDVILKFQKNLIENLTSFSL